MSAHPSRHGASNLFFSGHRKSLGFCRARSISGALWNTSTFLVSLKNLLTVGYNVFNPGGQMGGMAGVVAVMRFSILLAFLFITLRDCHKFVGNLFNFSRTIIAASFEMFRIGRGAIVRFCRRHFLYHWNSVLALRRRRFSRRLFSAFVLRSVSFGRNRNCSTTNFTMSVSWNKNYTFLKNTLLKSFYEKKFKIVVVFAIQG